MSCIINPNGSVTCCAPGGPCTTSARNQHQQSHQQQQKIQTNSQEIFGGMPEQPTKTHQHLDESQVFGGLPTKPPSTSAITITHTPSSTRTAGIGSNMAMFLIVGGFLYYAYSKGLLTK